LNARAEFRVEASGPDEEWALRLLAVVGCVEESVEVVREPVEDSRGSVEFGV
jgi:hypothetical protein